jgi:hypothetical protein
MREKNKTAPYDNELIKETAESKGLNPVQVAALSGKSVPTVYQIYNGESVTTSSLQAVVEAVGLRLPDIFKEDAA